MDLHSRPSQDTLSQYDNLHEFRYNFSRKAVKRRSSMCRFLLMSNFCFLFSPSFFASCWFVFCHWPLVQVWAHVNSPHSDLASTNKGCTMLITTMEKKTKKTIILHKSHWAQTRCSFAGERQLVPLNSSKSPADSCNDWRLYWPNIFFYYFCSHAAAVNHFLISQSDTYANYTTRRQTTDL